MATTRKFAYNTGSQITGATHYGSLAIGVTLSSYADNPGGVKWWGGPDEDLGYVIAHTVPSGNQPNPKGLSCSVGFWRTNGLNDQSFLTLVRQTTGQSFATASNAATWLKSNGYWTSYSDSSNDLEAQAFITAASITDSTQQSAINQLVLDLKSYNIWTKMSAIYPMVGGMATTHKFNLKNPLDTDAAFRLSFSGGWTHSSTGALPNGTNAFADTFYNPSVSLNDINSNHISFYSRTDSISGIEMGGGAGAVLVDLELRYSSTSYNWNMANYISHTNSNSKGMYVNTRTSSNVFKLIKNSATVLNSGTGTAGVTKPNITYHLAKRNYDTLWSNKECAFASIGDGLSDTNVANFYTAVQQFQTTLGRQVGVPIVSDSDAQAFLNAAVIEDMTQANAINTLVTDLKSYGIWTKMKAIYPFVGGTATTHKFNLKNPLDTDAAFRLVFNGGWTHSANGALPNGTNAFADTKLLPQTIIGALDISFGVYIPNAHKDQSGHGSWNGVGQRCNLLQFVGIHYSQITTTSTMAQQTAVLSKFISTSRLNATTHKLYNNGAVLNTNTTNETITLPNVNFTWSYINGSGADTQYGNNELRFSYISNGLTDTEMTNLYTTVQQFQTTLGRNV